MKPSLKATRRSILSAWLLLIFAAPIAESAELSHSLPSNPLRYIAPEPAAPVEEKRQFVSLRQTPPRVTPREPRPLSQLRTQIEVRDQNRPRDIAAENRQAEGDAFRPWDSTEYWWQPSELERGPLYLEELPLERYGHSGHPLIQPVTSGLHFFTGVLMLPGKMVHDPPGMVTFELGFDRPGNATYHIARNSPFAP